MTRLPSSALPIYAFLTALACDERITRQVFYTSLGLLGLGLR